MVDQEFQEYYKNNPTGNHKNPSPETLRFMENQTKVNEKVEEKLDSIIVTVARIEGTVGSILVEAKKTNGRVRMLEDWKEINNISIADLLNKEKQKEDKRVVWHSGWVSMVVNLAGTAIIAISSAIVVLIKLGN